MEKVQIDDDSLRSSLQKWIVSLLDANKQFNKGVLNEFLDGDIGKVKTWIERRTFKENGKDVQREVTAGYIDILVQKWGKEQFKVSLAETHALNLSSPIAASNSVHFKYIAKPAGVIIVPGDEATKKHQTGNNDGCFNTQGIIGMDNRKFSDNAKDSIKKFNYFYLLNDKETWSGVFNYQFQYELANGDIETLSIDESNDMVTDIGMGVYWRLYQIRTFGVDSNNLTEPTLLVGGERLRWSDGNTDSIQEELRETVTRQGVYAVALSIVGQESQILRNYVTVCAIDTNYGLLYTTGKPLGIGINEKGAFLDKEVTSKIYGVKTAPSSWNRTKYPYLKDLDVNSLLSTNTMINLSSISDAKLFAFTSSGKTTNVWAEPGYSITNNGYRVPVTFNVYWKPKECCAYGNTDGPNGLMMFNKSGYLDVSLLPKNKSIDIFIQKSMSIRMPDISLSQNENIEEVEDIIFDTSKSYEIQFVLPEKKFTVTNL